MPDVFDRGAELGIRLERRSRTRGPMARALGRGASVVGRGARHLVRNRRYLTLRKALNIALVELQLRLRTEVVRGRPWKMKIEPTNVCNTRCQLCPTGVGMQGRPRGRMDLDRFRDLIDELAPWLYTVDLSMWGDPLIHPDIHRFVRIAHDAGIWTYLSSNLHAFRPERGDAERLVESGLDLLSCSLHGASQAAFEAYQPGKRLDRVVDAVRTIVETRDRMGSATPRVELHFVVLRTNEHEREDFAALAADLGCTPVFASPSTNLRFADRDRRLVPLGLSDDAVRERQLQTLREWLPDDPAFVNPSYRRLLDGEAPEPDAFNGHKPIDCWWPWRASVINWDGAVVTCCGAFDPAHDLGNVFERPFAEIWNSEGYRMARRTFRRPVHEPELGAPCRDCPGSMP